MNFWEAFWLLAIWIPLILLWGFALVDLFHSDHSGVTKGLWAIAIIFLPVLGVVLYFALRPVHPNQYALTSPHQTGPDQDSADSIARLHDLNHRGLLDDEEFTRYKTYIVR